MVDESRKLQLHYINKSSDKITVEYFSMEKHWGFLQSITIDEKCQNQHFIVHRKNNMSVYPNVIIYAECSHRQWNACILVLFPLQQLSICILIAVIVNIHTRWSTFTSLQLHALSRPRVGVCKWTSVALMEQNAQCRKWLCAFAWERGSARDISILSLCLRFHRIICSITSSTVCMDSWWS